MTKNIVVTGSSSGLGRALAKELLIKRWNVYGIDICPRPPELDSDSYFHYSCDLADFEQSTEVVRQLIQKAACVDALVNCAGIMPTCLAARINAKEAVRAYNINVIAPLLLSRLFLKSLKLSSDPKILNVTSIAADLTIPGEIIYASSKAALKHATAILAVEFARYNVGVFDIAPALIQTALTNHLTDDQCLEMRRKQSMPLEVTPKDFVEVAVKVLEMPFSSTGSVFYVGGIAK